MRAHTSTHIFTHVSTHKFKHMSAHNLDGCMWEVSLAAMRHIIEV